MKLKTYGAGLGKRESMKEKELSFTKTIQNDWYAIKLGFSISKSLVVNTFFMGMAGYFEWVFFDAIFMREIVSFRLWGTFYQLSFSIVLHPFLRNTPRL